jgi:hypothetical protein
MIIILTILGVNSMTILRTKLRKISSYDLSLFYSYSYLFNYLNLYVVHYLSRSNFTTAALFKGYLIGDRQDRQTCIFHLQLVDGNLIMGENSWKKNKEHQNYFDPI